MFAGVTVVRRAVVLLLLSFCIGVANPRTTRAQIPVQSNGVGDQDQRFDHVRERIGVLMKEQQLPSISVAVAQHGKIIWEQGFGWADREQLRGATSDTLYSLASISKPFTATALMSLVQQGKINLDTPANEFLGQAKLTGLAGDASGATIRRILSHTSGLPLHWQFFYVDETASDPQPPEEDTILRYGILVNPPGETFQYSNLGFGILGHIVSLVHGMSYPDSMRTLVFSPLNLTHTSVGIGPGLEPFAAARYDSHMRPLSFYEFDHPGASAVYSSAHDLVRFAMFHLKDHLSDQKAILPDTVLDLMHAGVAQMDGPNVLYGLGFYSNSDEHGLFTVGHSGGMPGVNTIMSLYPSEDLAVVVLTNGTQVYVPGVPSVVDKVGEEIVAALVPSYARALAANPKQPQTPKKTYQVSPELAGTWTGTLRTWQGTIPLQLVFQPDGDIHVKLGEQLETLLNEPHWEEKELVGDFSGRVPTPDASRYRHSIHLEIALRNGKLEGEANAQATDEPAHFSLASYVQLTRKAN